MRARARSSVRVACRVPRHRLAASARARAVDDVDARSRVREADRDEGVIPVKTGGSPLTAQVVDPERAKRTRRFYREMPSAVSRTHRGSSRQSERRAAGVDARARGPRATASVAMKVRSRRAPRSTGGARDARHVAPRRSVRRASPALAGSRPRSRRHPSSSIAPLTLPLEPAPRRHRRRSAPRSSACATRARS